jgi:hypothetical protein
MNIRINELPDSLEYLTIGIKIFDYSSIVRLPANLRVLKINPDKTDKIKYEQIMNQLIAKFPNIEIRNMRMW